MLLGNNDKNETLLNKTLQFSEENRTLSGDLAYSVIIGKLYKSYKIYL